MLRAKLLSFDSASTSPSVRMRGVRQFAPRLRRIGSSVPMPPSISTQPSARVAPVAVELSSVKLFFLLHQSLTKGFQHGGPLVE
jgi:hypothetical protein